MKNKTILPFLILYQVMELRFPKFSAHVLLVIVALQLPVIGRCDSGNGWFRNFESKGSGMKELILTREVIIKDESGLLPEPQVISKTEGGGFVIAGSLGRAWAVKTDAAGKVLWRHLQDKPLADGGYATTFTGAVSMPDGSTYLCGNMYEPPAGYTPSLLMHLDAAGHVINEQLFVPQKRSERGLGYFDSCIRWGDGIAIVGHVLHVGGHVDGLEPNIDQCYWLFMLDANGKVKWEKQIPTTSGISRAKSLMVAPDSSLIFVGDEMGETELFRISETGELAATKKLIGSFQFVRSVAPDGILQVYGYVDHLSTAIIFNARFEEVGRAQGTRASDFYANLVFRMPDRSLVLFGRAVHVFGEQFASGIAHVDSTLQSVKKLELVHAPFYDGGSIDAALPTGKEGEFLTAKKLLKHVPGNELSNEARIGTALDFVQIK